MKVKEAIYTRRSIRKFDGRPVTVDTMRELVDAARFSPSAQNRQPLKYMLIDEAHAEKAFGFTRWASYIAPKGDPQEGERPTAYIVILNDKTIRPARYEIDVGAAAQTIALAAMDMGIASCLLGIKDAEAVSKAYDLPENLVPALMIALGYPAQSSEVYSMVNGDTAFSMTSDGTMQVPKRSLEEVIYEAE